MIQWILTYLVLFGAFAWTLNKIRLSLKPKPKTSGSCGSCSCSLKEVKNR